MKPVRLDLDPNATNAAKEWKHWKITFQNFIELTEASLQHGQTLNKLNMLINCVSSNVFEYMEDSGTYENAIQILEKLYVKTVNVIFARHLLATHRQQAGQSLDDFLLNLRKLSKDCNFKAVTADQNREELIRDAFINGMSSQSIRQRLLENNTLTLQDAFNQARSLDLAHRNSQAYVAPSVMSSAITTIEDSCNNVHANDKNENLLAATHSAKICYFCGKHYHNRKNCPALEETCYKCGYKGHFAKAKVCRGKKISKTTIATMFSPSLCAIQNTPECLSNATTTSMVHGVSLSTLIDTGSSMSFINEKTAKSLNIKTQPSNHDISMALSTLKGSAYERCTVDLSLNGRDYNEVTLCVIKNLCCDILLGLDFQRQHQRVIFQHGGLASDLVISAENTCALAAANVGPPSLFKNIDEKCRPIAVKSRRFNKSDRDFIHSEITRLVTEGIIQPSISPWRAQPLIVKDLESEKKRMCIDYSQTVNLYTQLDAYPLPRIDDIINKLAAYKVFSTFDLKSAYHQLEIAAEDRKYTAFEGDGKLWEFCRIPFGVTNGVPAFQREMDKMVEEDGLKDTYPYLDNITIAGHSQEEHDYNVKCFIESLKKRNFTLNANKTISSVTSIKILGYSVGNGVIAPDPERLRPLHELPPPMNQRSLKRTLGLFAYYAKWIAGFSDKIQVLRRVTHFPLDDAALSSFNALKNEIAIATLKSIDEQQCFTIECDASDVAVSATLNQGGRPVAFMSRCLQGSELHYPAVEKEATAIIEAVRKWSHFLARQRFTIVTDQRSVAFMLDNRRRTKIKNNKIQCWRLELASFSYNIQYRPGKKNIAPDTLTRAFCSVMSHSQLQDIHNGLCHPGVTRLLHFVKSKNLPFSTDDVKKVCSTCRICAEIKPTFYVPRDGTLIKATQPFERISIDFKGPLPSNTNNKYILTVVDEFTRFPFAFPCPNLYTSTVIKCLNQLFSLCGNPSYVHSDRGQSFMSCELKEYFNDRQIATSRSTPYHPIGNAQVERYNGIIWRAIKLDLKTCSLPISHWETVLPNALQSIRTLLCTATNTTPHALFFNFVRRSPNGKALPTWLTNPGRVFLRKFVRNSKNDDVVEEVELTDVNPTYANVRFSDGRESTVSLRDLSPCPTENLPTSNKLHESTEIESNATRSLHINSDETIALENNDDNNPNKTTEPFCNNNDHTDETNLRRSTRRNIGAPPTRYGESFTY